MATIARMIAASTRSPTAMLTTLATTRIRTSGLANWLTRTARGPRRPSPPNAFGPFCRSRTAASAEVKPAVELEGESEAAAGGAGDAAGAGDFEAESGGDFGGDFGGDASRVEEALPVEAGLFAIFAWYPVRAERQFWRTLHDGPRNLTWVVMKPP